MKRPRRDAWIVEWLGPADVFWHRLLQGYATRADARISLIVLRDFHPGVRRWRLVRYVPARLACRERGR